MKSTNITKVALSEATEIFESMCLDAIKKPVRDEINCSSFEVFAVPSPSGLTYRYGVDSIPCNAKEFKEGLAFHINEELLNGY